MISELKNITGSLIKSLDIIYVLEGSKQVSRLLIEENEDLLKFLSANNLYYVHSDFKIVTHMDKTRNFTDKGIKVDNSDPRKGSSLLYISKEKALAEKAKELESNGKRAEFGRILGYPECCCNFFEKNFDSASKRSLDLVLHTFKESRGFNFDWHNNYCLRGFDIALISHFPCEWNCKESKEIAKKNLEIIKKYNVDVATYFKSALKCAVLYSEGVGVYSFRRFKINKSQIEYSPKDVVASIENDLYNIIKRRDKLKILGKNQFIIGDVEIKDNHTFFGLFS